MEPTRGSCLDGSQTKLLFWAVVSWPVISLATFLLTQESSSGSEPKACDRNGLTLRGKTDIMRSYAKV